MNKYATLLYLHAAILFRRHAYFMSLIFHHFFAIATLLSFFSPPHIIFAIFIFTFFRWPPFRLMLIDIFFSRITHLHYYYLMLYAAPCRALLPLPCCHYAISPYFIAALFIAIISCHFHLLPPYFMIRLSFLRLSIFVSLMLRLHHYAGFH